MTTNRQTAQQSMDLLYNTRDESGDITFIVGSERIKAHRFVLTALSPMYEEIFDENPDRSEIHVPNVSADTFNVFLEFFYKDTVNLTTENVEAVLDLVMESLNDEFFDTCYDFIRSKITPQSVCWAIHLAFKRGNDHFLLVYCFPAIQSDPKQVFASDGFLHCDHKLLWAILSLNLLGCPETEVFNACIAWARTHCKQKKLDDENPMNLRAALGDVIYEIRFASMDAKEFAALNESLPGFFTKDEVIELFNIASKLDGFKAKIFNQRPRSDTF